MGVADDLELVQRVPTRAQAADHAGGEDLLIDRDPPRRIGADKIAGQVVLGETHEGNDTGACKREQAPVGPTGRASSGGATPVPLVSQGAFQ